MKGKHIGLLLTNFPLGIHIKFEKHLEEYQKNQGQKLDVSILRPKLITETSVTLQNTKPPAIGFDLNYILVKSTQSPSTQYK